MPAISQPSRQSRRDRAPPHGKWVGEQHALSPAPPARMLIVGAGTHVVSGLIGMGVVLLLWLIYFAARQLRRRD